MSDPLDFHAPIRSRIARYRAVKVVIKTRLITEHYPAKRVTIAALAYNTNGSNYVRNARFSRVSEIAVSCSLLFHFDRSLHISHRWSQGTLMAEVRSIRHYCTFQVFSHTRVSLHTEEIWTKRICSHDFFTPGYLSHDAKMYYLRERIIWL